MNNRHHKDNNQLSLTFTVNSSCQPVESVGKGTAEHYPVESKVIAFPSLKPATLSFRERVIQDLLRNRVMVE